MDDITKGNILIAKFIGGYVEESWRVKDSIWYCWKGDEAVKWREKHGIPMGIGILVEYMEFHKSWNWLMSLIPKFTAIDYRVQIDFANYCCVFDENHETITQSEYLKDKTEQELKLIIWRTLVSAIEVYNKKI